MHQSPILAVYFFNVTFVYHPFYQVCLDSFRFSFSISSDFIIYFFSLYTYLVRCLSIYLSVMVTMRHKGAVFICPVPVLLLPFCLPLLFLLSFSSAPFIHPLTYLLTYLPMLAIYPFIFHSFISFFPFSLFPPSLLSLFIMIHTFTF